MRRRPRGRARRVRFANGIVAIVEPTSRRSQRDGETVSCSSSAQRYGSARMPLPYGWARVSTVIQSSASAAARRRSCQVRSGSPGERPLERRDREPARLALRLAEQAIGDEQELGRRARRRDAFSKPRRTATCSGVRTPCVGPMPGRDERLAGAVLGIGELAERGGEGRGERRRVVEDVGERRAQLRRARLVPRQRPRPRARRRRRRAAAPASRSGSSRARRPGSAPLGGRLPVRASTRGVRWSSIRRIP